MIGLDALYALAGVMFAAFTLHHALTRRDVARWRSAGFWGLCALVFLAGSWLPDAVNGVIVLAMVGLAAAGLRPGAVATTDAAFREASARRLGNRLLLPVLAVPLVTGAGTLVLRDGRLAGIALIAAKQVTLACLCLGAVLGLVIAARLTRARPVVAVAQGRRLMDAVGWAAMLPLMLAALGSIFAAAGVGQVVAGIAMRLFPVHGVWSASALYALGMAGFTFIMGNAFAAFPVMTAGVGIPVLIRHFGGDPAVVAAVGMLSGFCGTLMTPMAANFNIVPAVVLDLPDRHGVIKVQIPTALALLLVNILVLALCAFPPP